MIEPLIDLKSIRHNDVLSNLVTKESFVVIRSWVGKSWTESCEITHTETYRFGKKILPKNFVTLEIKSIDCNDTLNSATVWQITRTQKETKSWSTKGFTKPDIFAYIVMHLGPQNKRDLLQMTAYLEDKDYMPQSNFGYFDHNAIGNSYGKTSVVFAKDYLRCIAKKNNAQVFGLGDFGRQRAQIITDKFGVGPINHLVEYMRRYNETHS